MVQIYLSAVDHLKNRKFDLWVPAFYHTHVSEHMLMPDNSPLPKANPYRLVPTRRRSPLPFHQHIDPKQMQRASYSTEVMIDMFQKKVEFELVDQDEIPEIFDGLDRYLLSLRSDLETGIETSIAYARLVVKFREEWYKHYFRYMKLNPTALEALYPNNNPTKNLYHLMSLTSGAQTPKRELDPLLAKSHPPYDIDACIPRAAGSGENGDFDVGGSLGLNGHKNPNVDERDWDYDAFLNKGG